MTREATVTTLLRTIGEQMWSDFNQCVLPHAAQLGEDREEIVRACLRRYLPSRYGVSTGFVFDSNGTISRQVDVVIYDTLECPVFHTAGGKRFFPCEGVVCVGEVKSRLKSVRDAIGAFEALQTVKKLDRTASDKNLTKRDGRPLEPHSNHLDQIFSFVFVVSQCLTEENMRAALIAHLRDFPRHEWPNVIFAFDNYLLTFACPNGYCPNPMHAWGISVIKGIECYELLAHFVQKVAQAVVVTSTASFSYWDYLEAESLPKATIYPFDSGSPLQADLPKHMRMPIPDQ